MNEKRNTLKRITSMTVFATVIPDSWRKPVVDLVVLPAHAQTSSMLRLDSAENVTFSRSNRPDAISSGSNYWAEFFIGNITGEGIQKGAVYSLLDLPEILRESLVATQGKSNIDMRITSVEINVSGVDRKKGEIFFYTNQQIFSDINGEYDITVQVKNPDGQIATTIFKLLFEGF